MRKVVFLSIFAALFAWAIGGCSLAQDQTPHIEIIIEGLISPIGITSLPDGTLLIAEDGTGERDFSAGLRVMTPEGEIGRLVSGFPSNRDSGDLAGAPLVGLSPDNTMVFIGNFGAGNLWAIPVPEGGFEIPEIPLTPGELVPAMVPLNDVKLTNPFDITFDEAGVPVVTDATGNGVAKENPDGTTRFIHRFSEITNPKRPTTSIDSVPTGITRIGDEYYVTLTGGCPFPEGGGQLVAIDEERNQRTVVDGLNMPIDVARDADGKIWVLEFATFNPDASCFDGTGYMPETGRLSRLLSNGTLEPVLEGLNYPSALHPLPDGSLLMTEVFPGRVVKITFGGEKPVERSSVPIQAPPLPPMAATLFQTGPILVDVASSIGLDFQHEAFRTGITPDPVAMMGGGLCWLDYNNDGWLDLYVVNSHATAETEYWAGVGGLPTNGLYQNIEGKFEDVRVGSGANLAVRGNGCVAADFNMDGWWDIYVTIDGPNALLWNNGDGTFTEGAAEAGVDAREWSTAAAVGDLNGDGYPDLFVAAYIDLENMIPQPMGAFPQDFYGLKDHLYLNQGPNGDGRNMFRDAAEEVGLVREERGLGALFSDFDNDGDLDLYIANDGHPNRVYANHPDESDAGFKFIDLVDTAGAGDAGSGMGVAAGDYDGDGMTDLLITNWQVEINAVYQNQTSGADDISFRYSTFRIGMQGIGRDMTGWGTSWLDLDHDTDLDLMVVNGMVPISDLVEDRQFVRFYKNRTVDSTGEAGRTGHFIDGSEAVGLFEVGPRLARGSAAADYDNDGDLDLAIATIGGPITLLENQGTTGNWLQIGFETFSPGARVVVTLENGQKLVREVHAGSSYLASEDPRLHFGLGRFEVATQVEVFMPDGREITMERVEANQLMTIP